MSELERRAIEFRATAPGVIEGRVVPYGVASRIGGVFDEVFAPGSMRFDRVMANVQHDRGRPLARLGHGLTLTDSAAELRARIELPDTSEGRDTRALIEAGVLTGLSAEFRAVREEWPAPDRRLILDCELRGLAVVDDPAHEGALIEEVRARLAAPQPPKPRRRIWL